VGAHTQRPGCAAAGSCGATPALAIALGPLITLALFGLLLVALLVLVWWSLSWPLLLVLLAQGTIASSCDLEPA